MKSLILLVIGAIIGSSLTILLSWAQQFGNTARAQAIRDEMDRKREKDDPDKKRNNPTHS